MERALISPNESLAILQELFHDVIFLRPDFTMKSIGSSVAIDLGFTNDELMNKPMDFLASDFSTRIKPLLERGYFSNEQLHLTCKHHIPIFVSLSGFYSGLITDLNGYIFIRYTHLENASAIHQQLKSKEDEMDHFIYQASHSLRGPVATIRGLINIAKIEKDPTTLVYILAKLEEFASLLDTKLYKLMCFAEADRSKGVPKGVVEPAELTEHLNQLVARFTTKIAVKKSRVVGMETLTVNEHLIESLVTNLITLLLTEERHTEGSIEIFINGNASEVEMVVKLEGFDFDVASLQALGGGNYGYGYLLEHPNLFSAYSVLKFTERLKGKISFTKAGTATSIHIKIPYRFISLKIKEVELE